MIAVKSQGERGEHPGSRRSTPHNWMHLPLSKSRFRISWLRLKDRRPVPAQRVLGKYLNLSREKVEHSTFQHFAFWHALWLCAH